MSLHSAAAGCLNMERVCSTAVRWPKWNDLNKEAQSEVYALCASLLKCGRSNMASDERMQESVCKVRQGFPFGLSGAARLSMRLL